MEQLWFVGFLECADECSPSLMTACNLAGPSTSCLLLPAFSLSRRLFIQQPGHCYWSISKRIILLIIQVIKWKVKQAPALSFEFPDTRMFLLHKTPYFLILQHLTFLQPLKEGFSSSRCGLFVRNGIFLLFNQRCIQESLHVEDISPAFFHSSLCHEGEKPKADAQEIPNRCQHHPQAENYPLKYQQVLPEKHGFFFFPHYLRGLWKQRQVRSHLLVR